MTLDDFLDAIQDHRDTDHHQFKHPLDEIFLVVLTGLLCGFDSYRSFARFAKAKLEWFRTVLPGRFKRAPSKSTPS